MPALADLSVLYSVSATIRVILLICRVSHLACLHLATASMEAQVSPQGPMSLVGRDCLVSELIVCFESPSDLREKPSSIVAGTSYALQCNAYCVHAYMNRHVQLAQE